MSDDFDRDEFDPDFASAAKPADDISSGLLGISRSFTPLVSRFEGLGAELAGAVGALDLSPVMEAFGNTAASAHSIAASLGNAAEELAALPGLIPAGDLRAGFDRVRSALAETIAPPEPVRVPVPASGAAASAGPPAPTDAASSAAAGLAERLPGLEDSLTGLGGTIAASAAAGIGDALGPLADLVSEIAAAPSPEAGAAPAVTGTDDAALRGKEVSDALASLRGNLASFGDLLVTDGGALSALAGQASALDDVAGGLTTAFAAMSGDLSDTSAAVRRPESAAPAAGALPPAGPSVTSAATVTPTAPTDVLAPLTAAAATTSEGLESVLPAAGGLSDALVALGGPIATAGEGLPDLAGSATSTASRIASAADPLAAGLADAASAVRSFTAAADGSRAAPAATAPAVASPSSPPGREEQDALRSLAEGAQAASAGLAEMLDAAGGASAVLTGLGDAVAPVGAGLSDLAGAAGDLTAGIVEASGGLAGLSSAADPSSRTDKVSAAAESLPALAEASLRASANISAASGHLASAAGDAGTAVRDLDLAVQGMNIAASAAETRLSGLPAGAESPGGTDDAAARFDRAAAAFAAAFEKRGAELSESMGEVSEQFMLELLQGTLPEMQAFAAAAREAGLSVDEAVEAAVAKATPGEVPPAPMPVAGMTGGEPGSNVPDNVTQEWTQSILGATVEASGFAEAVKKANAEVMEATEALGTKAAGGAPLPATQDTPPPATDQTVYPGLDRGQSPTGSHDPMGIGAYLPREPIPENAELDLSEEKTPGDDFEGFPGGWLDEIASLADAAKESADALSGVKPVAEEAGVSLTDSTSGLQDVVSILTGELAGLAGTPESPPTAAEPVRAPEPAAAMPEDHDEGGCCDAIVGALSEIASLLKGAVHGPAGPPPAAAEESTAPGATTETPAPTGIPVAAGDFAGISSFSDALSDVAATVRGTAGAFNPLAALAAPLVTAMSTAIEATGSVGIVLRSLAPAFGSVVSALAPIGSAITAIVGSLAESAYGVFRPAVEGIAGVLRSGAGTVVDWSSALHDSLAPVRESIAGWISSLASSIAPFTDAVGSKLQALFAPLGEMAGKLPDVAGKVASGLSDAFTGLVGVVGSVTGGLGEMVGAVSPFVQALNPSLMALFNRAMLDLQATIGVAFAPIIDVAIGALRELAGVVKPVAQELAPIMATLAQTIIGALMPVIRLLADAFKLVLPVVKFFADLLSGLIAPIEAVFTVLRTILQAVAEALGGLFGNAKSLTDGFKSLMESFAAAILKATAAIALLFGATGFVDKLLKNLREQQEKPAGFAAGPGSARVEDFSSIAKELAQAAFSAQQGASGKDPVTAWRENVIKELQTMQKEGPGAMRGILMEVLKDFLQELLNGLTNLTNTGGVADYIEQHTNLNLRGNKYGIGSFSNPQEAT